MQNIRLTAFIIFFLTCLYCEYCKTILQSFQRL